MRKIGNNEMVLKTYWLGLLNIVEFRAFKEVSWDF